MVAIVRTTSALAIVAVVGLAPEGAKSAEITGCIRPDGTLTQVAPGTEPARGECRGRKAKKVSVPLALNAGEPGSARLDTYTFYAEVDSDDPEGAVEVPLLTIRSRDRTYPGTDLGIALVYLEATCRFVPSDITSPDGFAVLGVSGERRYDMVNDGEPQQVDDDVVEYIRLQHCLWCEGFGLGSTNVKLVYWPRLAPEQWARLEAVATVVAASDRPDAAACTFSGKVEVFLTPDDVEESVTRLPSWRRYPSGSSVETRK